MARLRPDVIVQLWRPTADDLELIARLGYDRLLPSLFVRADAAGVDRVALERVVCALVPAGLLASDFGDHPELARAAPPPRWDADRIWRDRCPVAAG